MITTTVQRWRDGQDRHRPAGEVIRTSDYEVAPIQSDNIARAFICAHHYSGTYPAARFRFGLYRHHELVGVAVFSHPARDEVLACLPGETLASCELGRFVLLDDVPGNGETWFLGRAFESLRRNGMVGVVSFSDPMPRETASGARIFPGHLGIIYQAHNAVYLGRARSDTLRLLPDGKVMHSRALSKIRKRDQGWRYAVARLEAYGIEPLGDEDPSEWLARCLPSVTRKLRHPGNHKYAWTLQRRDRRHLPASLPYPKREAA